MADKNNSEDFDLGLGDSDESPELDGASARRRMLMRLGVYGAVSAPVLLASLRAEKAVAATGGGIPGGNNVF